MSTVPSFGFSFVLFFLFRSWNCTGVCVPQNHWVRSKHTVLIRARFVFKVCICLSLLMQLLDDCTGDRYVGLNLFIWGCITGGNCFKRWEQHPSERTISTVSDEKIGLSVLILIRHRPVVVTAIAAAVSAVVSVGLDVLHSREVKLVSTL